MENTFTWLFLLVGAAPLGGAQLLWDPFTCEDSGVYQLITKQFADKGGKFYV